MKAVILNSGIGSRMGALTKNKPKCLAEISNNETILSRQIEQLLECGINDILITIRPFGNTIPDYVKEKFPKLKVKWVRNEKYNSTNYIFSMYLAGNELRNDVFLMHGDMVFDIEVLRRMLLSDKKDLVSIDKAVALPEKDFKCRIEKDVIHEIGINLIADENVFFLLPVYKLSGNFMHEWMNEIEKFVSKDKVKVYAENAFNEISGKLKLYPLDLNGLFCMEIDTADDLAIAEKRIV